MANEQQQQGTVGSRDYGLKELGILSAVLVALVAGAVGVYWGSGGGGQVNAGVAMEPSEPAAQVTGEGTPPTAPAVLTDPAAPQVVEASPATHAVQVPAEQPIVHADIYFDFNRTRLRADSVGLLQDKAALVKTGGTWVMLVQGYADQQGPAEYNRALAQRRATSVKQFLIELGVPEGSIRVVTVGQEGALCDELTAECQQLNRRVHLEMRQLVAAPQAQEPSAPAAPPSD